MRPWVCPKCKRRFKSANQSHSCTNKDIGELFLGKPDELVLAFDVLLQTTASWAPNSFGAATHSIVFTNSKAWLIIKPMKTVLDIKFYYDEEIPSDRFHKIGNYFGKFAHHIRVSDAEQLDKEFFELIRIGYDYAIS
jgi:hypothetical protein